MSAMVSEAWSADGVQAAFMVGGVARLALAAIFAGSALTALRDRGLHAAIVAQYRILPAWGVAPAAVVLPGLSVVAAVLLLAAPVAWWGALLSIALLGVFTVAIGVNLARGRRDIDCGCGGGEGQRLSGGLLVRNLGLMALSLVALGAPSRGVVEFASVTGMVGGAAAVVALYFAANQLLVNAQRLAALGGHGRGHDDGHDDDNSARRLAPRQGVS